MRQVVLVFQIERGRLGRTLPLLGESLKHTLLERHRRVIFTKPSIENTADAPPLLNLLQQ